MKGGTPPGRPQATDTEGPMPHYLAAILRWSTIRWVEIFFILGLPLAFAAAG